MVISVSLDQYDNGVGVYKHMRDDYPNIYIYSKDHVLIKCQANINDRTIFYIEISFSVDGKSYIDIITEDGDDYGKFDIIGTPLCDLLSEIANLHDKEYDRVLFNDYVLKLQDITKQLEYRISSSFNDFINLNLISNTKSAK